MVKVIIERHVEKGKDILPLLRQLRAAALHYAGYITGETLVGTGDECIIVVIATWHSPESWRAWEASETRAKLCQQIEPLLVGKPRVETYQIMATEEKTGSPS
jgi:quinol monooxygenase YgiN